ncbi:hypothetical protein L1887_31424 [Cichorium endivia]|nr:hypothetical protein L1887_31424 [Cichorium endivia]
MSQKKTNSVIHVPFSWEKIPGVPKFMASPMCALVPGLRSNNVEVHRRKTLPLPPGFFRQPLISSSKRIFSGERDPFLAAILECTKDCDDYKGKIEMKKSFGSRVWTRTSFLSSCKQSFDVEECHLSTRPSSLGSVFLRERGLIQIQQGPRK